MASAQDTLKKLQAKVIKTIETLEASEFFEKIPDVIRTRTREGHGITYDGGKITTLPKLKESTIDRRLSLDNAGKLSNKTAPFFSNLTERGILLDSLMFKKVGKTYTISFDERRKRNGVKPSEIKDFLEEKGFVFFGLAATERAQLEANVAKKLEKEIKKIFR